MRLAPRPLSLLLNLGLLAALSFTVAESVRLAPLAAWLLLINLWVFLLMLKDKRASRNPEANRTPEFTLLTLAFLGGSPGLLAARHLLRHKSGKESFRTALYATLALQVAALAFYGKTLLPYLQAPTGL